MRCSSVQRELRPRTLHAPTLLASPRGRRNALLVTALLTSYCRLFGLTASATGIYHPVVVVGVTRANPEQFVESSSMAVKRLVEINRISRRRKRREWTAERSWNGNNLLKFRSGDLISDRLVALRGGSGGDQSDYDDEEGEEEKEEDYYDEYDDADAAEEEERKTLQQRPPPPRQVRTDDRPSYPPSRGRRPSPPPHELKRRPQQPPYGQGRRPQPPTPRGKKKKSSSSNPISAAANLARKTVDVTTSAALSSVKTSGKAAYYLASPKHVKRQEIWGVWRLDQQVGKLPDGPFISCAANVEFTPRGDTITRYNTNDEYRTPYTFVERTWPRSCYIEFEARAFQGPHDDEPVLMLYRGYFRRKIADRGVIKMIGSVYEIPRKKGFWRRGAKRGGGGNRKGEKVGTFTGRRRMAPPRTPMSSGGLQSDSVRKEPTGRSRDVRKRPDDELGDNDEEEYDEGYDEEESEEYDGKDDAYDEYDEEEEEE